MTEHASCDESFVFFLGIKIGVYDSAIYVMPICQAQIYVQNDYEGLVPNLSKKRHMKRMSVYTASVLLLSRLGCFGFVMPSSSSASDINPRSEEHTSELQSRQYLVCRLLLE